MGRIVIANDHAAVKRKEELKAFLEERGYEVVDLGVGEGEPVDYPDKAAEACRAYLNGGYDFGVLCCGTGVGISIAANKIKGIRCALPQNRVSARLAREHNDCQFIAFGGRIDYVEAPELMLDAFIGAEFEGGRHVNRIAKIMDLQEN